jgi:D-alanyl-lipoteichoic acid acyltransferase DltB (MBOAT superfamily)
MTSSAIYSLPLIKLMDAMEEPNMLFNSFEFIFVFLPIVFIGYFFINQFSHHLGKLFLLIASLFFYRWWSPVYLYLFVGSMVVNGSISFLLYKKSNEMTLRSKKALLITGIVFNVILLGFFKYYNFFMSTINSLFHTHLPLLDLILPLAISFYTFQQIAFLVDVYRGDLRSFDWLRYGLFIAFFPQLIAGPIVHHSEVMDQYDDAHKKRPHAEHIAQGLLIFSVGLFKKVIIADTFMIYVNDGFNQLTSLSTYEAWITSLSYTFQLYFDFSGYSDMAIGIALLFNITLPLNFNRPYRAVSIQDFWRRWHITLSRFLTQYIYIPLGGSKKSFRRTLINTFIVFFISGFWHGAGFTFIIWGSLHGLAMIIRLIYRKLGLRLPKFIGFVVTFLFIHTTWVIFRAPTLHEAYTLIKRMYIDFIPTAGVSILSDSRLHYIIGAFVVATMIPIVHDWVKLFKKHAFFSVAFAIVAAILFIAATLQLENVSEFLYFNF